MTISTKTIRFSANVGEGVEITQALATIFRIQETSSDEILTEQVSGREFSVNMPATEPGYYYIVLQISRYHHDGKVHETDTRNISLLAVFDDGADSVAVSAQSTIANVYAFARMIRTKGTEFSICGTARKLRIAYGMKNNFILTDGTISDVISSSPNGLETNSYPLFNFLSNLLYYNLTDTVVYNQFLSLASPSGTCASFLEALMCLVNEPFTRVQEIYQLISSREQIFLPSLPSLSLPKRRSPVPDQWTLTIKVNDSGAQNFLFSGTAFVVFDKEDKAWITNNFRMGSPESGTHCVVLNSDGSPCEFSPIFGGGILGPGFGIAIDATKEKIAIGNYGWGPMQFNPQKGSVSMFSYDGTVLSPPNGHTNKVSRAQGMCYDCDGNLWIASMGSQQPMAPSPESVYKFQGENSAIVVYPGGDPQKAVSFDNFNGNPSPYHGTFDVVIDSQGHALVSNIGSKTDGIRSSVHKFRFVNNKIECIASWISDYEHERDPGVKGYEEFRQVQVNADDEVFVVGISSSRVIKLDQDLQVVKTFQTNIYAPWGIMIDGQGTLFVSNFAQERGRDPVTGMLDMQGPYGVTVIRNEDDDTAQLMTLPTGGNEVMLANGQPLYGSELGPSYEPIMRLTSTNIDGAGNLWAMNNWKPSAYIDVKDNPGGDGVVIFVGVAEPCH